MIFQIRALTNELQFWLKHQAYDQCYLAGHVQRLPVKCPDVHRACNEMPGGSLFGLWQMLHSLLTCTTPNLMCTNELPERNFFPRISLLSWVPHLLPTRHSQLCLLLLTFYLQLYRTIVCPPSSHCHKLSTKS